MPYNFHLLGKGDFHMKARTRLWLAPLLLIATIIALQGLADGPGKAGDVNEARVLSEAADGSNWLLNGRTFEAQHFSPLREITDQNITKLGLAWFLDIDSTVGIVAEPM